MADHVVYILGAGFSAPAGIPVMSRFVSRSKDLYTSDPSRFAHFKDAFALFETLSKVKNYYETDLSNIEEVLSILAASPGYSSGNARADFVKYIASVVEATTPKLTPYPSVLPSNWRGLIFGSDRVQNDYGNFLCALTRRGMGFDPARGSISHSPPNDSLPTYSVVTLNYDCLLEGLATFAAQSLGLPLTLFTGPNPQVEQGHVSFAKLHGCTSDLSIVPPTWSKGTSDLPNSAWELALSEIGRANHIRILGYSLPPSDLNIRYLLKAAALTTFHLKTIHVGCLDSDNQTKVRYDSFIDHPGYRFNELDIGHYLSGITERLGSHQGGAASQFLEDIHRSYFP